MTKHLLLPIGSPQDAMRLPPSMHTHCSHGCLDTSGTPLLPDIEDTG